MRQAGKGTCRLSRFCDQAGKRLSRLNIGNSLQGLFQSNLPQKTLNRAGGRICGVLIAQRGGDRPGERARRDALRFTQARGSDQPIIRRKFPQRIARQSPAGIS